MLGSKALKVFFLAFLLVLAGGLIFVGSGAQGFSTNSPNSGSGIIALIGLAFVFLGLLLGFIGLGA